MALLLWYYSSVVLHYSGDVKVDHKSEVETLQRRPYSALTVALIHKYYGGDNAVTLLL